MAAARDAGGPTWLDGRFLQEAREWVGARLAESGLRAERDETTRVTPWSVVVHVHTCAGTFWFKANADGVAHEAGLLEVLARRAPGHTLVPLAVDRDRGWMLLPDGGPTLRDVGSGADDRAGWERMLVEYADLQRTLEPYVGELLAAGTPDRRPDRLVAVRDALLADRSLVMVGHPKGLTEAQYADLLADRPTFATMCRDLEQTGIAATVQHDDLHDNNVFAAKAPGGSLRVFDWGDSVVGHPFGTLLVTLRVVAMRTGWAYGSRGLLRLRDAYLEPWTGDHDRATLEEACRLALRVGCVLRADCYRRALLEATPAGREEFGDGVPGWLSEHVAPTPVEAAESRPR